MISKIESAVQQVLYVNSDFREQDYIRECRSVLDSYRLNTASRLCKYVRKYRQAQICLNDVLVSLRNYLLLYQTNVFLPPDICISENSFGLRLDGEGRCYAVMAFPEYLNEAIIEQAYMRKDFPAEDSVTYFLGVSPNVFRITGFKCYKSLAQKLAVTGALNIPEGYSGLISLPTGGGKSLISQTIAYQREEGLTIVVVPTVSLAMDQERLSRKNIRISQENEIFCYYSKRKDEEKKKIYSCLKNRSMRLLFISPEALVKNQQFVAMIEEANEAGYLKNIVIDEAHIVIEWGTFFRVDYQCLEPWRNKLIRKNPGLRTILLSATFERKTVNLLKSMFSQEDNWIEIRCDSLRKEPRFDLIKAESEEDKNRKTAELLKYLPRPMVVYVTAPFQAELVKKIAENCGFGNVVTFTGATGSDKRRRIIKEWSENEYDLIIATSAFGVGVDKPDVRTVLHLYVPENANKYYQELGRGGRDGLPCLSVMCIYPKADLDSTFNMTTKVLLARKIVGRWNSMLNSPASSRYEDTYILNTAVKPDYQEPDYAEDVKSLDVKWNVYVILLLRRRGLLKIIEMMMDPDTRSYMIRIQINNELLLHNSPEMEALIEKIREEEWKETESDFHIMRKAIAMDGERCWSEMFFETYSRVSVFCGGCKKHLTVFEEEKNRFSLVKKIEKPMKKVPKALEDLFGSAREAVMLTAINDFGLLSKIIEKGFQILVIEDSCTEAYMDILLNVPSRSDINFMGMKEYIELLERSDFYFVSGAAILLYDKNLKNRYRELARIRDFSFHSNIRLLHVFEKNLYFNEVQKDIVSMIDGPVLEEYDLERTV